MKTIYLSIFITLSMRCIVAQVYTHPTVGVNGTYAGNCVVNTCTGTYTDNGGAGNYALNINQVYRVFCPNTAGNCVRITFNSFVMEGMVDPAGPSPLDCYFDYLTIGNGSTQNSPAIDQAPSSAVSTTGRICGNPTVPFSYTATSPNGCLSVRMNSDVSNTFAGWSATISCVPCAGGPTGTDQTDCPNRVQICNDLPITWNSPGPGLISEACSGCSVQEGEDHSAWYVFQVQAGGTIGLNITPANPVDDYDFVIYGPGATCASLGSPIRCSYACTAGTTGLGGGAVDVSEQCGPGNGWVAPMPVTAGQIYYMLINHWDPPISGYTLDWVMSGGATLNCTPLPVELTDFRCEPMSNQILLYWATSAEVNNNCFVLEKSQDGENFTELRRVTGKGFSNETTEYLANDEHPSIGTNYYRLRQVDYDGNEKIYSTIACEYGSELPLIKEIQVYDLNGQQVLTEKENTKDLEVIVSHLSLRPGMYMMYITYENGTTNVKKFVKI